jgi:hypothetical protein
MRQIRNKAVFLPFGSEQARVPIAGMDLVITAAQAEGWADLPPVIAFEAICFGTARLA